MLLPHTQTSYLFCLFLSGILCSSNRRPRMYMDRKMKLDQLFGPKDSSSSAFFGFIFPPSSTVGGRDSSMQDVGCRNKGTQGNKSEQEDQKETEEPSYYSSSIYYGGQENYSQRDPTTETRPVFKKDGEDDGDANRNSSNSASRGNWWQGSLYY